MDSIFAVSVTGCTVRLQSVRLVTACVVYGRFDSKIRFENESDGRFDSIRTKKRFAGP